MVIFILSIETIGVSIVVHNSDTLFPTNLTNQTVSGDIITAIVTGIGDVSDLSEPIAMEFTVSFLRRLFSIYPL